LVVYWRTGVFITDNYAVANGLVNVANGHLAITEIRYSLTLGSQPGLMYSADAVYARNYAHIFLSLPVLWILEGVAALFDIRLVLVAGHAGLVLVFFERLGRVADRHRLLALAGSALATGLFLTNVVLAPPLLETWLPLVALQLTTMLAVAFTGVVVYRLLAHLHGHRVGLLIGAGTVLASPVGFWASIPKRHSLSTLAVVTVLAAFYFSRTAHTGRRALGFRVLAYVTTALFAWLHGLEAFVVLVALVTVDFATAHTLRPRQIAVISVVFLVALSPFLLTNLVVTGNPLQPPRSIDQFRGQVDPLDRGVNEGGDAGARTSTPVPGNVTNGTATENVTNGTATGNVTNGTSPTTPGPASPLSESDSSPGLFTTLWTSIIGAGGLVVEQTIWAAEQSWGFFDDGLAAVQKDPSRLYHTFLRSGRIPVNVEYANSQQEAIDLALFEAAPLLGGLAGVLGAGVKRMYRRPSFQQVLASARQPERQVDLLAVVIALLFLLTYIERLPIQAQITVRYLLPIVPLGLYGVGRLGAVHRVVEHDWQWLAGSYLTTVVLGSLVLAVNLTWLNLAIGEAMQFHALLWLASASLFAVWTTGAGLKPDADRRTGAVVFAIPAGLTTVFLLFTGLVYFQYGQYALPIVEAVTEWFPVAV